MIEEAVVREEMVGVKVVAKADMVDAQQTKPPSVHGAYVLTREEHAEALHTLNDY